MPGFFESLSVSLTCIYKLVLMVGLEYPVFVSLASWEASASGILLWSQFSMYEAAYYPVILSIAVMRPDMDLDYLKILLNWSILTF